MRTFTGKNAGTVSARFINNQAAVFTSSVTERPPPALSWSPDQVTSSRELAATIKLLNGLVPCPGYFKPENDDLPPVHGKSCEGLVPAGDSATPCTACRSERAAARKKLRRASKPSPSGVDASSRTRFDLLSSEEQRQRYANVRALLDYTQRKLARATATSDNVAVNDDQLLQVCVIAGTRGEEERGGL